MATQGPLYPSSGTNDASIGTAAWANPGNITLDDGSYAVTDVASGGTTSNYIKGSSYGFSIPGTATINGILVEVDKRTEAGSRPGDQNVRIIKSDGTLGSENKAQVGTNWTNPGGYVSYGGASDLWSESWTPADINDADFGIALNTIVGATGGPHSMQIDTMRITISYTEPVTGFNIALV